MTICILHTSKTPWYHSLSVIPAPFQGTSCKVAKVCSGRSLRDRCTSATAAMVDLMGCNYWSPHEMPHWRLDLDGHLFFRRNYWWGSAWSTLDSNFSPKLIQKNNQELETIFWPHWLWIPAHSRLQCHHPWCRKYMRISNSKNKTQLWNLKTGDFNYF